MLNVSSQWWVKRHTTCVQTGVVTTLHVYTCSAVKYYVWAQGNKSYFHEAALNSVSVDNEYVHSKACCSPLLFIKMSVIRPADCSKLPDAKEDKCCRISTCYEYCQSCLCQGPAVSCESRTSCILCVKDQLYHVCQGQAVSCVIDHLYLVCHRPAVSWVTDHLYLVCHRPAVSCVTDHLYLVCHRPSVSGPP